jgi:hypothetical protein
MRGRVRNSRQDVPLPILELNRFLPEGRAEIVDVLRGFALLIMVFIQIFDVLSAASIYRTPPYYVALINSVTWIPPSLLFTFVSGMSSFLLIHNQLKQGSSRRQAWFQVIKRYGIYVLISLPFTTFMWNADTYFAMEEAIEGIGVGVIASSFLWLFVICGKLYRAWLVILLCIIFQGLVMRPFILTQSFNAQYPMYISGIDSISRKVVAVSANIVLRGWFSLVNTIPLMIGGILFFLGLRKMERKDTLDTRESLLLPKPFTYALFFSVATVLLHILGFSVDYYERSFSYGFFASANAALLCLFIAFLSRFVNRSWLEPLRSFGVFSFYLYVGHYVLIIKVVQLTGTADLLPDAVSWVITLILTIVIGLISTTALHHIEKRRTTSNSL